MAESIKDVLIRRDGMESDEADALIADAKEELQDLLDAGDLIGAQDICADWFGLEEDYVMELL